jgi:enoyl-[acyl-carrier protein] reductase I
MLEGKKGIIFGVANHRSIAWACAEAAHAHGARLAFTYQGERLRQNVEKLISAEMPDSILLPCDVTNQKEVEAVFAAVEKQFGRLDFLIHSIAFAPREAFESDFVDTTREAFLTAMEVSVFSLPQLAKAARGLMKAGGGSIVTMTYYGAEKVVQGYNVMGVAKAALEASTRYLAADLGADKIRVNAISAGPIKTLAAAGAGAGAMLKHVGERAPLKRNVSQTEVGNAALFFISDLSGAITGETIHVDCGYNIMGI